MKKYEREKVTLYCGDCRDVLPTLKATSFDAAFEDPPYGLEFMGLNWDKVLPPAEIWAQVFRLLKPGAHMLAFGGPRTFHRLACSLEDTGFEIRDCMAWIFGGSCANGQDISKAIDKKRRRSRTVVGCKPGHEGFQNGHHGNFGAGRERPWTKDAQKVRQYHLQTAPASAEAKQWDGYRTRLKPAWEPLVVSMKPTDGTFVESVLTWECGGLNVDGCRVPAGGDDAQGRYPSNVLLDPAAAELADAQGHAMGIHSAGKARTKMVASQYQATSYHAAAVRQMNRYGDTGGASRFFYCPKASKKERGEGNDHPCVKPLRLCEYLARLLLPPKRKSPRTIIVPFAGSGSEMIGALRADWDEVIGIEIDPKYFRIACERLDEELG
jgi:site-specific DNA-methyltransferase (adenine-specific)